MDIFLNTDLNIIILKYLSCCDRHFNIFVNCNKTIKNNFFNNPSYYKIESLKNYNMYMHYKNNMLYYKSKFYHLKNSLSNAMNQNIYLFGDNSETDTSSNYDSDEEIELQILQ